MSNVNRYDALLEKMPKIIAGIEKHFPGAKIGYLGRDSYIFGDFIDAFYQSIGQKGRVTSLGISGTSNIANTNDAVLESYLKSKGLDLTPRKEHRPFVIIDTASKLDGAGQPRALLDRVYKIYKAKGGDPLDLVGKLTAVTIVNRGAYNVKDNFDGAGDVIKSHREIVARNPSNFFPPRSVLVVEHDGSGWGFSGYDVGSGGVSDHWHESFKPLQQNRKSSVDRPGAKNASAHRKMLGVMASIIKYVATQPFQKVMNQAYTEIGLAPPYAENAKPNCTALAIKSF